MIAGVIRDGGADEHALEHRAEGGDRGGDDANAGFNHGPDGDAVGVESVGRFLG